MTTLMTPQETRIAINPELQRYIMADCTSTYVGYANIIMREFIDYNDKLIHGGIGYMGLIAIHLKIKVIKEAHNDKMRKMQESCTGN